MQIIVNGLVTTYQKSGNGPVIVMLHGWADTLHTFDALVTNLEQNYTVIRIDLAGFGGSQPPANAWGIDEYALQIRDFLQKMAIRPNDIELLIGHSNGGTVSIHAVGSKILLPKKLVLIASAGVRSSGTYKKLLLKSTAKVGKVVTFALPKNAKSKLRQKLYNTAGSDMLVAGHMEDTFKKIITQDVQEVAKKISIPTCIIYGEKDDSTPLSYAIKFNSIIPASILHSIKDAGHFVHQQSTNDVYKIIREFGKA